MTKIMPKEQTPITAEEMAKQIRNFVQVMSFDQKGNSEFLEKRVAEYLEQYANAKVLEGLEMEVPKAYGVGYYDRVLNSGDTNRKYKDRQEYYETEVKPKYDNTN